MDDVAALVGVSTSTVSRALRGSSRISAGTRMRVQEAASQLDFAPSRAASGLASGRLGRIGVLVSGPLSTWFNSSVLEAAYATLRESGYELGIYRIRDAGERTEFFTSLPVRRNVDALVVVSFALTPAEYTRMAEQSVPVVYLNQQVPDNASVFIDDAEAAAGGTRHLINLGHRRLGYVTTRDVAGFAFSASSRLTGVQRALRQHSVAQPDDPAAELAVIVVDALGGGPEVGQLAVGQLLSGDQLPTAVVAESDEIAMSLLPALQRAGLKVPADVSVLGFDDNTLAPLFDLTTVAQPVAELGRRAARAALTLSMSGPDELDALHRALPTHLVLRGSTTVPRPHQPLLG